MSVPIFFLAAICFVVLKLDSKVEGGLYLKAVKFDCRDLEVVSPSLNDCSLLLIIALTDKCIKN